MLKEKNEIWATTNEWFFGSIKEKFYYAVSSFKIFFSTGTPKALKSLNTEPFISVLTQVVCFPRFSSSPLIMYDVNRFVDKLYIPELHQLGLFSLSTKWHRYDVDLNRLPSDIDDLLSIFIFLISSKCIKISLGENRLSNFF